MIHKSILSAILCLALSGILLCGCSNNSSKSPGSGSDSSNSVSALSKKNSPDSSSQKKSGPPRDNAPQVLTPEAAGSAVFENDFASIDASHTDEGYFMVKYLGQNSKVKIRVTDPDASEYIYLMSGTNDYETFPLPCGNGSYQIQVLENVEGDTYALAHSADLDVTIRDEFLPFLYPNQYVNFSAESQAVSKGSDLAKDSYSDLDVVENVYHFVTQNISYDTDKAENVAYGYLPVIDETLQSKKGICFDYASLMCAMLRSQGIPTKLQVGYSGEAYHAWISTYVTDVGWVDDIIEFDGTSWTLMDPTLAASNDASAVGKYIGDGSNYDLKFSY